MYRKIRGTNFFHIKFLDRNNIKFQNGPVLPPAQVFYYNSQALILIKGDLGEISEMPLLPLGGSSLSGTFINCIVS
jgi:hypothetical protein